MPIHPAVHVDLLAAIMVALAFDYADAARYLLGGVNALVPPA
jgi:hypothetical protein